VTNTTSNLTFSVNINGNFNCDNGTIDYVILSGNNTASDTYVKQNDCTGCFGVTATVTAYPGSLTGGQCA